MKTAYKLVIMAILVLGFIPTAVAQNTSDPGKFAGVLDQMASFPGGINAFKDYVYRELDYPKIARKERTEGDVTLNFTIAKMGGIKSIEVLRSDFKRQGKHKPSIDAQDAILIESKRLIATIPYWMPSLLNGIRIETNYNITLHFILDDKQRKADPFELIPVEWLNNPCSTMLVRIAEIEVYPEYVSEYLAAAKEVGFTSVRQEPGVVCIFPMLEKADSTQIRILEIYSSNDAYQAHLKTDHFLKYKQGTLKMVKSLKLPDMEPLHPWAMPAIFKKM